MNINNFFQSKFLKISLIAIGGIALLLFVFGAGIFVGSEKAKFSYQWGDNYYRNFAGPRGGFIGDFRGENFIEAHGVFGQIIKIDPSSGSGQAVTLVIKGKDNVEKNVLVKDSTAIERLRENVKISDLKVDDYVVVIGAPDNSGQIEAKLIRIMPAPSGMPFPLPTISTAPTASPSPTNLSH